jgi:hypothetical protein
MCIISCVPAEIKKDKVEKDLIRRYFENRVSEEEKEQVATWLAGPENQEAVLNYLESAYDGETGSATVAPFGEMFRQAQRKDVQTTRVIPLLKRKWVWAAAAACILFFIGAGTGYLLQGRKGDDVLSLNTAFNGPGPYAQLTLSDGSEVYLGSDSRLSFPRQMDIHPVVYLEGEAYFNVPDQNNAVTVKTKDLVTTAKGSKFNIKAFCKDSVVTVTVEKGKVEVTNNNETFPLLDLRFPNKDSVARKDNGDKPKVIPFTKLLPALTVRENEQATYDKNTYTTGISEVKPGTMPMLKIGPAVHSAGVIRGNGGSDLNFYKADISQIVNKIEHTYNVTIDLNTNGNHLPSFTGEFEQDEDINKVLDRICNSLGLEYSIKDSRVKINLLK